MNNFVKGEVEPFSRRIELSDKGEAFLELLHDAIIEGRFSDARDILDELILCYEPLFPTAPVGKTFQECYDVQTVRPTEEYSNVYTKAVDRVRSIGLDMRY